MSSARRFVVRLREVSARVPAFDRGVGAIAGLLMMVFGVLASVISYLPDSGRVHGYGAGPFLVFVLFEVVGSFMVLRWWVSRDT